MVSVSVLTPSIPERVKLLHECNLSVIAQTTDDFEHLVMVDERRDGCSVTMNKLAAIASGEWLLPLADDDLLLPRCVETLLEHVDQADVVYTPPLVTGNEDRWWFYQAPPVIPAVALIRADLWHTLGGYDESVKREEDRGLWIRALKAGAVFKRIDEPCWVYRMHPGNKSMVGR